MLYKICYTESESGEEFIASHGWFSYFKVRRNLHNSQVQAVNTYVRAAKVQGEAASIYVMVAKVQGEAASIYVVAAKVQGKAASIYVRVTKLKAIIREGNYLPEQIFNSIQVIPEHMDTAKEKRLPQGIHNKITIMVGSNVASNLKLKHLLVYYSA